MNSRGKVSVIILTYNSISKLGKFFDRVLESVLKQDYPDYEVFVVDNGSADGTPRYVEKVYGKYYANLRVVRLGKNYGWSGGNNRGALLARDSRYLLFMNDDVILLESSLIHKLVSAISKQERLAAVQPLIINRDGTLNCGLDLGLSGLPKMIQYPRGYPLSPAFYVSGAALLTRTEIFFKIGMFDKDLFLYHDDADYSWRLRLVGYEVACIVDAKAYHLGSATLGVESPQYYYYLMRNNIWVIAKNSSIPWLFIRLLLMLLETQISFVGHMLLKRRDAERTLAILRGLIDGFCYLKTSFSKRFRDKIINDEKLNKSMNPLVDVDLILPKTLRKALGFKW